MWTNYKKELDAYHGALEFKDLYTKEFLKQTRECVATGDYDVTKMLVVLDVLVSECSSIATNAAIAPNEAG